RRRRIRISMRMDTWGRRAFTLDRVTTTNQGPSMLDQSTVLTIGHITGRIAIVASTAIGMSGIAAGAITAKRGQNLPPNEERKRARGITPRALRVFPLMVAEALIE